MLVLTRKPSEAVIVAEPENMERRLKVTVLEVLNGKVRLGFEVDPEVVVHRAEVWEKVIAGWEANPTSTDSPVAEKQSSRSSNTGMMIGQHEGRAIFTSTSLDGTNWLFIVLPDNRWTITRNTKRVAIGGGERASVNSGVRKFMLFATAAIEADESQADAQIA